jgi:hypothetical protein
MSTEVIRQLGKKLRELIPDQAVATTEMHALLSRLALLETTRRSRPGTAIIKADSKPRMA